MSGPEGTGARRPLRSAGWILLGLAVAAALIGVAGVGTSEGQTSAGERTAASSSPAPGDVSATPSPALPPPAATTATSSPTATPTSSSPDPGLTPPAPAPSASGTDPSPGAKGSTRGEARVYDNSTISGLAAQAASDLRAAGWTVVEVGNYPGGRIPTTTVYYQEGTDERRTAETIGDEFRIRVEPWFEGIADAEPGVIVIVTNDYGA